MIHFSHYSFPLARPFREGHVLVSAEAEALNGLRAEMIRERARRYWDKLEKDEMGFVGEEELEGFRVYISEVDKYFTFGEGKRKRVLDGPLAVEVLAIARDRAEVFVRQNGELGQGEEFNDLVKEFAETDEVRKEGERRLRVKLKVEQDQIGLLLEGEGN